MYSCSSSDNKIYVQKDVNAKFDSLTIDIHFNRIAKINHKMFNTDTIIRFNTDRINSGHDIIFSVCIYKGSSIIDSFQSFNDLGLIPNQTRIYINENSKLKVVE